MNLIKMFLSMVIAASICNSETITINISGAIVDSSDKAIAGAEIRLEKAKISTKSDENGIFTLMWTGVGIKSPWKNSSTDLGYEPFIIQNSKLIFALAAQSGIDITVYGIQGQVLGRIRQSMNAGSQTLALPEVGNGLYLYRIKIGNAEYVLKGTLMGRSSGGALKLATGKSQGTLAKQAKAAAAINDVITATKTGYLNYRCVQYTSDTTGIVIKMIASAGTLTDTDGNVYQTVRIGNQVWMTENLRVTKYSDGTAIPLDTSTATWNNATTPKFCYYSNTTNADSIKKYGALYNWYVVSPVNTKKLAPAGWHVPTDSEWDTLQNYLIAHGYNYDGTTTGNKIGKSLAAKTDWASNAGAGSPGNNLAKNNSSGFSALPGGCRYVNGAFFDQSEFGYWWWLATEEAAAHALYHRCLCYGCPDLMRLYFGSPFDKSGGMSVRLLGDSN